MPNDKLGFVEDIRTAFGNATPLGKFVQIAGGSILAYTSATGITEALTGHKFLQKEESKEQLSWGRRVVAGVAAVAGIALTPTLIKDVGNNWMTKGR